MSESSRRVGWASDGRSPRTGHGFGLLLGKPGEALDVGELASQDLDRRFEPFDPAVEVLDGMFPPAGTFTLVLDVERGQDASPFCSRVFGVLCAAEVGFHSDDLLDGTGLRRPGFAL
jgi:hypothetical protein